MTTYKSWHVGVALIAASQHVRSQSTVFTEFELVGWVEQQGLGIIFSQNTARAAMSRLYALKLAEPKCQRSKGKVKEKSWSLTNFGVEASLAAWRGQSTQFPSKELLSTRLWNLLRIRGRMTSEEAASTLLDAGDDRFSNCKKEISAQLRAWAKFAPDAVAVAAKREAGHLRYVLVKDLGRWPPPSRAGEIHPNDFERMSDVPDMFRKPAMPVKKGPANA